VSKSNARTAAQLLNLRPRKTTVIHKRLAAARSSYQSSFLQLFLQSIVGEIDSRLTFFSAEAWFHLQGYINIQNYRYWSSQNSHLTQEVPLQPMKVGVWYAVSARRIVPVFFTRIN
jgi:hypothetical protein